MMDSTRAIRFLETLKIPEGPMSDKPLKLAPFQKQFVCRAFDPILAGYFISGRTFQRKGYSG
jgi:hypothetical protein